MATEHCNDLPPIRLSYPPSGDHLLHSNAVNYTSLSRLFTVAAIHETATFDYETGCHRYLTDRDGLLRAMDAANQVQETLTLAVQTISALYAHVDHRQIPDVTHVDTAWLTAGLGELLASVNEAHNGMGLALIHGGHLPDKAMDRTS